MAKKFQLEQPPYRPFPRQIEFHISPAKYRLFGGAAGPGKSRALMEEAIQLAAENPGVNCLLLRRTYGELESSIIEPMRKFVLPFHAAQGAKYNESTRILRLPNASNVYFGYCRNENDVYQYQGGEFFFIGIDELTHFTLKQWQFLTSRNRCPVKTNRPPGMAGATNPGNIGHAWVKALFIDHTTPPGWDIAVQPYEPNDYDFIRATLADNPIYANDVAYKTSLQALPANMRRAFLNGDWDIFAGQYFTNFEKSRHEVPRDYAQFDDWIQRWIGIDWGFGHNSAIYWNARLEDKRVFTYRELICNNLSPKQLGEFIVQHNQNDDLAAVYLSPDAYAKRENYITIADQISDVFRLSGFPMCQRADNDRVSGWSLMYDLLDTDQWVISEQCENLINTIPLAVRDPDYLEDVCFIGDTEILTDSGPLPIRKIIPGDMVATRQGWKAVKVTSSRMEQCYTLKIADGREITGTASHPIWHKGKHSEGWDYWDWKSLYKLDCDDKIPAWKPFGSTGLLFIVDRAEDISFPISQIPEEALKVFIEKYGKVTKDQYQRGTIFTTLEDLITTFPTSIALQNSSITADMERQLGQLLKDVSDVAPYPKLYGEQTDSEVSPALAVQQYLNLVAAKKFYFAPQIADINTSIEWPQEFREYVLSAEKSSNIPVLITQGSAPNHVLTVEDAGRHIVYNLEVEDCPEYLANGILVHNCKFESDDSIDAARYSLKSHIKTSVVPLAERINRQVFTPEERQLMVQGGSLPDMTHRIRYMLELQKKQSPALLPAPIKRFKGRRHEFTG